MHIRLLHKLKAVFLLMAWIGMGGSGLLAQEAGIWEVPSQIPGQIDLQNNIQLQVDSAQTKVPKSLPEVVSGTFSPILKENSPGKYADGENICWLKFELNNPRSILDTLWLHIGHFDKVKVYENGALIATSGYLAPLGELSDPVDRLYIPIPITQPGHTYYIEVKNEFRTWNNKLTPFLISNETRLIRLRKIQLSTNRYLLFAGLFLGLMLLFMGFSLYQFIGYRDKVYLVYAGYILGLILLSLWIFESKTPFHFLFSYFNSFYSYFEVTLGLLCAGLFMGVVRYYIVAGESNSKLISWVHISIIGIIIYGVVDLVIKILWGLETSFIAFSFAQAGFLIWMGFVGWQVYQVSKEAHKIRFYYLLLAFVSLLIAILISLFVFYATTEGATYPLHDILANHRNSLGRIPVFYLQIGILLHIGLIALGIEHQEEHKQEEGEMESPHPFKIQKRIRITERQYPNAPSKEVESPQPVAIPQEQTQLEAFKLQLKPHFLFNFLNSIIFLIQNEENDLAEEKLVVFSQYLRKTLQIFEKKRITLKEELALSESYIAAEQLRLKDFSFKVIGAENIDLTDVQIPPLIFQPYLENAISHGLREKKGGKYLTLTFAQRNNDLLCIIEDNGIGRKEAKLAAARRTGQHNGLGMKISEKRLKEADMKIKVIDKYRNGVPKGTRVELTIPDQFE